MIQWVRESLARRLVAITAAVFFSAFIILTFFLYHMLLMNYRDAYADSFHNEVAILSEILAKSGSDVALALKQEVILEPGANHYQYFIQIRQAGKLLIQTPGLQPMMTALDKMSDRTSPVEIKHNRRVYVAFTTVIRLKDVPYAVSVLLDITPDVKILQKFKHSMMIISLVFILIFFGFVILLVKLGLKPLNLFVNKIKSLTPNTLEPVELAHLPSELALLLSEINHLIVQTKTSHEELSSFASNIAHELRTPINNLMISNERFLMKHQHEAEVQEQVVSNVEEYRRLSNLIDKLLFLARLSADDKKLTFGTLVIRDEVDKVIEFHEALADEKQIIIKSNVEGEIRADKDLLHNALSNILTNAIKYSPSNSCINIITNQSADMLVLSVVDEGPGLPLSEIEKITTRFYRFNKYAESHSTGLGLGLSIVNSIMNALGARLNIQLNPEKGLSVSMVFTTSPTPSAHN